METRAWYEALSDANYGSNYDKIFEDYSPKLDGQTPAIDELNIYSRSGSSNETDYGDGNNEFIQDDGFMNDISRRG